MLTISKISDASTQIKYENFEHQANFFYTVSATYTFNLIDVKLNENKNSIVEGLQALKQAYFKRDLTARIGTDLFEKGRVLNIDIPANSMTGDVECSITIEETKSIPEGGSNNLYANMIPLMKDLKSFSEEFSFSRNADTYSYSRNVNISWNNNSSENFLRLANIFIKNHYLYSRPSYGFQVDGISEEGRFDSGFKPLISENYDLINNSASFTEDFTSNIISSDKTYSYSKTYSLSVDSSGFLKKTYNYLIKAIKEPQEIYATNAVKSIIESVTSENENQFGKPVSIEKNIPKDNQAISLSINFDSDPSKNQTDKISYQASKSKRGPFYDYSISLEYSVENPNENVKYENLIALWKSNKDYSYTKLKALFTELNTNPAYEKSRSVTFDKTEGTAKEQVSFTTELSYAPSDPGVLKYSEEISINGQVNRIFRYLNLYDRRELFTSNSFSTIGRVSVLANIVTQKSRGHTYGLSIINSKDMGLPASNVGIESDSVKVDLSNGTTSRSLEYNFY